MMPSPVNLSTVPPYRFTTPSAIDKFGHDLPEAFRTHGRRDVHGVHDVGKQHRHLLVLRRSGGLRERRTALAAELRYRAQLGAARATLTFRDCQRARTVAIVVHVNIVSPLVRPVCHILSRTLPWRCAGSRAASSSSTISIFSLSGMAPPAARTSDGYIGEGHDSHRA